MNLDDSIVSVDQATVRFNIASEKVDNLKEYFIKLAKHQLYFEEFLALKNISLKIKKGESWGLIGRNGAGKSTLLKLICGILTPYRGSVTVRGSIAPLIELGAGLDPRLTAGENIFLNGALLGHSKKYMQEHFDEIVDFADLGNFLDMPIKNYSSGMRARLGFSIATTVCPDILIVDEVLAVGDAAFRKKCERRMERMLSSGTTLLFVSHSEREVERLCKNAIWLDRGEIVMSGPAEKVCFEYSETLKSNEQKKGAIPSVDMALPRVTVVGAGYVGLVTAAAFASMGYKTTCIDTDHAKIKALQKGLCPLFEPQLDEMLKFHAERLHFTTEPEVAYDNADAIIVAVGTPEKEDGGADLSYMQCALQDIAENVKQDCVIIIKSTVPVGTNQIVKEYLEKHCKPNATIHVVSNPEFLSQGTAVHDMLHAHRIVIGADSKEAADFMERLYKPFNLPIVSVSCASAEMIKYASNDFLALKISYINEIANLCERTGADIKEVALGMSKDPRIGAAFLKAGVGYGGSCFPKDTKALHWLAASNGYELKTIRAAIDVNERQKLTLIEKAQKYYSSFEGLTVTFLGVTFKPNTDDLREAPSLVNARYLISKGAWIKAWDPCGGGQFKEKLGNGVRICETIEEALQDSDICMIFTEWEAICNMEIDKFVSYMKRPVVLDGRNCFEVSEMEEARILYESVGRYKTVSDPICTN